MKLNKKIDIKSISTVLVLLVVILVAFFSLNFTYKNNIDSKNNLANLASFGLDILQQYDYLNSDDELSRLGKADGQQIVSIIDETLVNLDKAVVDMNNQNATDSEEIQRLNSSIKAIDDEIKAIYDGSDSIKAKDASLKVFMESANLIERNYVKKNAECRNITPLQRKAKGTCNAQLAKLSKDLENAIAKFNAEKNNKLPALESQKLTADKSYTDKVAACAKLPNTTPAQKRARATCNTQATNLKKVADNLVVQIETERRYAEVSDQLNAKREQRAPLVERLGELNRRKQQTESLLSQAGLTKNSLFLLKERIVNAIADDTPGCTDNSALNYNNLADVDDGTCDYGQSDAVQTVEVCTDSDAMNYKTFVDTDKIRYVSKDSVCEYSQLIAVCTEVGALNYVDPEAVEKTKGFYVDNGVCVWPKYGCMNRYAVNFDPDATMENPGSCLCCIKKEDGKNYACPAASSGYSNTGGGDSGYTCPDGTALEACPLNIENGYPEEDRTRERDPRYDSPELRPSDRDILNERKLICPNDKQIDT